MYNVAKTTSLEIKVDLNYTGKHNFQLAYGPNPSLLESPLTCNQNVKLKIQTASSQQMLHEIIYTATGIL